MAGRAAKALNMVLHGVCSNDFHSEDQDSLQDVFHDYFTGPTTTQDKYNDSESSDSDANYDTPQLVEYRWVGLHKS